MNKVHCCGQRILQAQLLNELDLSRIGGATEVFVSPSNGSGSVGLIWVNSPGIFMSKIYLDTLRGMDRGGCIKLASGVLKFLRIPGIKRFSYLKGENRKLFCMSLMNHRGQIFWSFGEPPPSNRPYCSHQGESLVAVADLNCDQQLKILAICAPGWLGMFDLKTGEQIKKCKLPADNFSIVRVGRTGPRPKDWTIMVGVGEEAYSPHSYSNPIIFMNADFFTLREYDVPAGIGHDPQVFDADGDGFDEFLGGYTLVDHTGHILWIVEGFEKSGASINAKRKHADCIEIIDRGKPNSWMAAIAGSDTTYLIDHRGKVLWKQPGVHPQYIMSGRFDPTTQDKRLFLLHMRKKMEMLDLDGKQVWEGMLPANWPLGRPDPVKNDYCFHMGKAASLWRKPFGTSSDLIVYNEAGWPYAVDGLGHRCVEFPCPESARQPKYKIPPRHRPDDYGYGYRSLVSDVDGDGKEEVILYDRQHAWIFGIR